MSSQEGIFIEIKRLTLKLNAEISTQSSENFISITKRAVKVSLNEGKREQDIETEKLFGSLRKV